MSIGRDKPNAVMIPTVVAVVFVVWCSCWSWVQCFIAFLAEQKDVDAAEMDRQDICATCDEMGGDGYYLRCGDYHCHSCLRSKIISATTETVPCGVEECTGFLDSLDITNVVEGRILENYLERVIKLQIKEEEQSSRPNRKRNADYSPRLSDSFYDSISPPSSSSSHSSPISTRDSESDESNFGFDQLSSSIKFLVAAGYSEEDAVQYFAKQSVLLTTKTIKCNICLDDQILPGDGIIIKNCLHMVCRTCLIGYINASESPEIECPCADGVDRCREVLLPLEVRELCSVAYEKHYIELSLKAIEQSDEMSHCFTPNCHYFCDRGNEYIYTCPDCKQDNCYRCKLQHTGLSCSQHKEQLEREKKEAEAADWDRRNKLLQKQNDLLSQAAIERNVSEGVFRPCPKCKVLVEKNAGCDHMICSRCKFDYQWSQAKPKSTASTTGMTRSTNVSV